MKVERNRVSASRRADSLDDTLGWQTCHVGRGRSFQVLAAIQYVTKGPPNISDLVQFTTNGRVGKPRSSHAVEMLLQQQHRPMRRAVATNVSSLLQGLDQKFLQRIGPKAGSAGTSVGYKRVWMWGLCKSVQPVVNTAATHSERAGNFGWRTPFGHFEQSQRASVNANVSCGEQLRAKYAPLFLAQMKLPHWCPSIRDPAPRRPTSSSF
jgi:hypothetical protein